MNILLLELAVTDAGLNSFYRENRQWLAIVHAIEEKWYRAGDVEIGLNQCLVQDPDGYLLRLTNDLGDRPISAT
ncbi:hypothetical protein [Burkholderia sp. BCC1985]|uniref:hypothetical protein n=1 Tax=Burkholderia sp. BCC1985 TaxID=2817442 RepID=UPI002AAF2566|nr:hypothetical protein [Burkholderia sp. BCC1985]